MCISSLAGRRLAVARAQLVAAREAGGETGMELLDAYLEMDEAAEAVADELIAQRFHEMEGD